MSMDIENGIESRETRFLVDETGKVLVFVDGGVSP